MHSTIFHLSFLILIIKTSFTSIVEQAQVEHEFIANEIKSSLNLESVPTRLVEISYPNGACVELGNELTPTQVKSQPTLKWEHEEDALYTVLMTDPDAPSRQDPKFGEVRHWLVVNVPKNNVEEGDAVFEYIGSGPPKDTGLHRYIFLIFKQNGRVDLTNTPRTRNCSRDGRLNSKTKQLIDDYNLGGPLFGNFYQAQYDDYVPELHKQFSDNCSA